MSTTEVSEDVVEREKDALREELEALNGTQPDGPLSVITVPRPGSGGSVFVSGQMYFFTNFAERAYVLGENTAKALVAKYPNVLKDATVRVRAK